MHYLFWMAKMNKKEILSQALQARIDEVEGYQINIENYTLAIAYINETNDEELSGFKKQLTDLLATEKLEQKKSKVILEIIKKQLGE